MFKVEPLDLLIQTAIPTVYAKGMSFYETLAKVIDKVNELTAASNEYFQTDVSQYVTAILEDWHTSGYLGSIISAALQTDIDAVEADLAIVSAAVDTLKNENVNVSNYGATGDGVTDDTQAFKDAIDAVTAGGTLIIPTPAVRYKLTDTLIIAKPMRIVGSMGLQDFVSPVDNTGNVLEFASGVYVGLDIRSISVELEGFTVDMVDTSNSLIAGVYYNVNYAFRFMLMRRMVVHLRGMYGACVKAAHILVSKFDGVQCHGGLYGFWLDEATTIHWTNCWCMNQVAGGTGYKLYTVTYSTFTGCAADSTPHGYTGYDLGNCQAVTLIGCGSEQWQIGFVINGSFSITLLGCLGASNNALSNAECSFCKIDGFSLNVSIIGCEDKWPVAATNQVWVYPNAMIPRIFGGGITTMVHNGVVITGDVPEVGTGDTLLVNPVEKYRRMMIKTNGAGVADDLYISIKDSDDVVKWRKVTLS